MDFQEVLKELNKESEIEKEIKAAKELSLRYDSIAETLEPIYFWILDFFQDPTGGLELKVEKFVDNFTASPTSGHFADIGARATRMQEEGMKILATINTVIRSIINLLYDLKEFEIRLKHYDDADSEDEAVSEPGLLALKQVWMDKVDIRRGRGSINMLTAELDFVTLRDAFMKLKSAEDVDKGDVDLNERVKRILKPRLSEFYKWKERSERELRMRYELEKTYLKSQVNSVKLYTRWVKPYFKAAEELGMGKRELGNADLVTAFNSIIMELLLVGYKEINKEEVEKAVGSGGLPPGFEKQNIRTFYSCVFVDFYFRGIPQAHRRGESMHYLHGGRTNISFKAFSLREDEFKALKKRFDEDDVLVGMQLVEGLTDESLEHMHDDLVKYMEEKEEEEEKKGFDFWDAVGLKKVSEKMKGLKKDKEEKIKEKMAKRKKDTYYEAVVREFAKKGAVGNCEVVYDVFKKAHGMATP